MCIAPQGSYARLNSLFCTPRFLHKLDIEVEPKTTPVPSSISYQPAKASLTRLGDSARCLWLRTTTPHGKRFHITSRGTTIQEPCDATWVLLIAVGPSARCTTV